MTFNLARAGRCPSAPEFAYGCLFNLRRHANQPLHHPLHLFHNQTTRDISPFTFFPSVVLFDGICPPALKNMVKKFALIHRRLLIFFPGQTG
jgi:hypothetical protein